MSRYQKGKTNLDFTEARDSEWQWHQLVRVQVCISLQTDNHTSTAPLKCFTGWMPFLPPNQQRQSTECKVFEGVKLIRYRVNVCCVPVQFVQRVLIMLMPPKYQPDYMYLRHVPLRRVHLFTAIQVVCLIGLWVVKTIKEISIIFPLMVCGCQLLLLIVVSALKC